MLTCALRLSQVKHRPDFLKVGISIFLSLNFLNDSVVAQSRRIPLLEKRHHITAVSLGQLLVMKSLWQHVEK